jgi:hypothetical protein
LVEQVRARAVINVAVEEGGAELLELLEQHVLVEVVLILDDCVSLPFLGGTARRSEEIAYFGRWWRLVRVIVVVFNDRFGFCSIFRLDFF